MSIKNKVVLHNPTTKKHEPLASGDVLAGSIIQVSTDAGNLVHLGTDGGLKVEAVAQLPGKQVEFGTVLDNPNKDVAVTFTTPFPVGTVPFITLTPRGNGTAISDFFFDSLSNTGFTLKRGYLWSGSGAERVAVVPGLQDIEWKAEEK